MSETGQGQGQAQERSFTFLVGDRFLPWAQQRKHATGRTRREAAAKLFGCKPEEVLEIVSGLYAYGAAEMQAA